MRCVWGCAMEIKRATFIKNILTEFYYLKLCLARAGAYIDMPVGLLRDFAVISMFLNMFHNMVSYFVLIPICLIFILISLMTGSYDIKYRFAHLENTINNTINPELKNSWEILERIKKIERKLK